MADPHDFSDRFNTVLTPEQEAEFQKTGLAKDAYDFDIRGQWQAGMVKDAANGHIGDDRFKKPNHPTYSVQSAYEGEHGPGGQWQTDGSGKVVAFIVSPANLQHIDPDDLRRYFDEHEKGVQLVIDPELEAKARAEWETRRRGEAQAGFEQGFAE